MVSEVLDGIYMISLPFLRRRVKSIDEIKLYVIRGKERDLLIDTGLNEEEYYGTLKKDLDELGVSMDRTDIFLTHMHPDHSGLLTKLKTENNRVYAVAKEAAASNALHTDEYWRQRYPQYKKDGLPLSYEAFIASHPACEFFTEDDIDFTIVEEDQIIEAGDYRFRCIITPGHSPAHVCLYDETTKTLLAGDMILSNAAPVLFFDEGLEDPLGEYLKSLDIVEKLPIDTILPCHGMIKFDVNARIKELRDHYADKCRQITGLLREHGPMTAWQTAEHTTRAELPRELSSLSDVSKWFFFLPACMTLNYLAGKGEVKAEQNEEGVFVYSI